MQIPIYSLESILDTHLAQSQNIDVLSIDCEGLDLEVLQSNNFSKYRPSHIIVEISGDSLEEILGCKVNVFLESVGYKMFDKAYNSVFFKDCSLK